MKGYDNKEAMAGHRYDMSAKHKRRESEGMKRYEEGKKSGSKSKEVLGHDNKHMFGINTMSEKYDMSRVDVRKQTTRGQPPLAWDYDY